MASGTAICSPLLNAILSGCTDKKAEKTVDVASSIFNGQQQKLIRLITDTILPKTESPSASEVGVDQTIISVVDEVYTKEDRETYKKGFKLLEVFLTENGFLESDVEQRENSLRQLESTTDLVSSETRNTYLHLKQQTIAFYLSTEEIAKKELNYLPVPGEYQPCIPLSETGGKAWAI